MCMLISILLNTEGSHLQMYSFSLQHWLLKFSVLGTLAAQPLETTWLGFRADSVCWAQPASTGSYA